MKRRITALLLAMACLLSLLPAAVHAEAETAMTKRLADYFDRYSYLGDDARVTVVIRLNGAPTGEELANLVLRKMEEDSLPYYEARKAVTEEAFLSIEQAFVAESIQDEQDLKYYTQCDIPTIDVETTKACILELSKSDRVQMVDIHRSMLSTSGAFNTFCYYGMDEELYEYMRLVTTDNWGDPVTVKIELNGAPTMEELQVLVREKLKDQPQPITAEHYASICDDVLREAYLPVVENYAKNTLDRWDVFAGKYEYSEHGVGLYLHTALHNNLEVRSLLGSNEVKLLSRAEDAEFTPITVEYDQASDPVDPPVDPPTDNPFTDVLEDKYYTEAVLWALEESVTSGKTATTFAPDDLCTRAEVVTFLWRACGSPVPQGKANPFADISAEKYYTDAVLWAVEHGITAGVDDAHFAPNRTVTRSEFVTFLFRAKGSPDSACENPFADVPEKQFYTEAVLWAVDAGITTGVSDARFAPGDHCTRAQVTAFLYRAAKKSS